MQPDIATQLPSLWELFARTGEMLLLILKFSPYWGPPVLISIFAHVWLRYVRARFISGMEYIVLEIRPPVEVMKSPAAMQAIFDGLWMKGGEATFIDRLWYGKVRTWYSFELASHEGQVHLYVWTRRQDRRAIERTFYAHYSEVEVVEVPDYATEFPFSLETYSCFGLDYGLSAPIGVPIRTYTDFHLDQTSTKEEQKIDPLAHVLEYLGSLGPGEHAWIQILCRANKREDITFGLLRNRKSYDEIAREEVSRIRNSPEETIVFPDGGVGRTLSDRQIKRIQAMNRIGLSSTHWDVGIRGIYLAEHERFRGENIPGLITIWQPFGSPGYNGIKLNTDRWQPLFDYPWQDFRGIRENRMKVRIVDAFRQRSWFHAPYQYPHFYLTSEELATLWHVPGSVAQTPTFQRISSARGQAPANLPH